MDTDVEPECYDEVVSTVTGYAGTVIAKYKINDVTLLDIRLSSDDIFYRAKAYLWKVTTLAEDII